ncbi:MAG: chorismate mutase [Planctomycetes bacterium]|nr:chorismate mutase [Planctomycetota bacterium]
MERTHEDAPELAELRRRIDALDAQLVKLISERGRLAVEIGRHKCATGTPSYAPDRETLVLGRLRELNRGPFPDAVLQTIYRELMSGSLALERPPRIAFLGPRGSFSHLAAAERFGAAVEYEAVADIRGAFAEVEREHVDYAVVPVENTLGGGVIDTLDAFVNCRVRICAEINRVIHHNVLSRTPLEQVERLYSKPEVFDQCRQWLAETGLLSRAIPVASTSKAAELFGLPILFRNIEDDPNNVTRFFVLGREPARPTGNDKTALMFAAADRAGALVEILDVFRVAQVNLTMITSRPSRHRNWDYYFFVDATGHADEPPLSDAVRRARQLCLHLSVLGSFPRAPEVV